MYTESKSVLSTVYRHLKVIIYAVYLISAILLEGCISLSTGRFTIIDLGGAIDNIGKQTPHLREEA